MPARRTPGGRGVATGLVLAAALVAWLAPAVGDALVLDRDAVRGGELWRVATGSLVHFSASHLGYNLLAVGLAGWLLEARGRRVAPLLIASAIGVGAAVMMFAPELARYGGLSGVAYALVVTVALDALGDAGAWRRLGATTLAAAGGKLAWEWGAGVYVLVDADAAGFVPVPVSHAAGAVVAAAMWVAGSIGTDRRALRAPRGSATLAPTGSPKPAHRPVASR
ncbi:MAG TPA: rhombosortase [Gemmatimonadaceae bacterium]|nr:rhombosortase [Gemmatimonadaceae bacterium]